jgi:hypothetical protein
MQNFDLYNLGGRDSCQGQNILKSSNAWIVYFHGVLNLILVLSSAVEDLIANPQDLFFPT